MDLELRSYDEQSERGPVEWPDGPAQPEPAEPAESGGPTAMGPNRSMARMTAIMAANILCKGAPGAQDTQNQQAQNGQPQGGPNQNPYYGPYAYNPNYGPNGQPAWGPDGRRYQADGQSNSQADGQPNGPWGDQSQPGWQQTNWYVGN